MGLRGEMFSRVDLYASGGDNVTNTTEKYTANSFSYKYDVCYDDQGDTYSRKIQPITSSTSTALVDDLCPVRLRAALVGACYRLPLGSASALLLVVIITCC